MRLWWNNSPIAPTPLHVAPAILSPRGEPRCRQLLLEDAPIPALGATVARAPRSKATPVEATRKSARGKGLTEGTVLQRAILLKNAADKANDSSTPAKKAASPTTTGTPEPPLSDFSILQSVPLDSLLKVAKDSCILFDSTKGSPEQLVALIQARELAQAELAVARHKIELEAAKAKAAKSSTSSGQGAEEIPQQEAQPDIPGSSTGKTKKGLGTVKCRRAAKRPNPIGRRPYTRQARALGRVSQ
ncbi:hypothetical protein QYE76_023029 [Lolium multiflorum]|uniref:Uncharacterized protein n=1 Tax=Lolium multiflorum TaxID=4521 RepID=A0AAD8RAM7_LOLMU|nr:hypothetical protein QYE76_023029 [Lolium multiflorum]